MQADGRFRVNTGNVIHEKMDGEVIAIHLVTGAYYSMQHVGAAIWELLVAGHSAVEIRDALAAHYDGAGGDVQAALFRFVEELVAEGLLVAADAPTPAPAAMPALPARPFRPPVLAKYTDMADMLLLDPIHEVEDTGWPTPRRPERG